MRFRTWQEIVIAGSGGLFWPDTLSWQRSWGANRGDANAQIHVAIPRLTGPLVDGVRTSDLMQRTLAPDGSVSDPVILTTSLVTIADGMEGASNVGAAFGFSPASYGVISPTRDAANPDARLFTAPSPTGPLSGGVVIDDIAIEAFRRGDLDNRSSYAAIALELAQPDGGGVIQLQVFDPDTLARTGGPANIAALTGDDPFWNLSDWNDSRAGLLSETPGADIRLRTLRLDGDAASGRD